MKKRRLLLCSLSLLTAAMLNFGMKHDGIWQVQAEEDTEEVLIEGEDWGDPDPDAVPDYSILSEPFDGDIEGENTEEFSELEVELGEEKLLVPGEKMLRIGEGESGFPEEYEKRYFLLYDSEETENITLYLNQKMDAGDIMIYEIDVEKQQANDTIDEKKIRILSDELIAAELDKKKQYLIVFDKAEEYPELSVSFFETQKAPETEKLPEEAPSIQVEEEAEPETEFVTEYETESVTETATESETEPETESVTEYETEPVTESVTESEMVSVTESETEAECTVTLESADLILDEGLDMVPAAMLPCLEDETTARIVLHYSDGSWQIPEGETDSYGNSCQLTFEDTEQEDGSISRTYTWKVMPAQSSEGEEIVGTETILFRTQMEEEIDDIRAQEKTKVSFSGKKHWLLVQTVPQVTGKYSMKSFGREVKELYYLAEGAGAAEKAGDAFDLNKGVTYTFLLKLE